MRFNKALYCTLILPLLFGCKPLEQHRSQGNQITNSKISYFYSSTSENTIFSSIDTIDKSDNVEEKSEQDVSTIEVLDDNCSKAIKELRLSDMSVFDIFSSYYDANLLTKLHLWYLDSSNSPISAIDNLQSISFYVQTNPDDYLITIDLYTNFSNFFGNSEMFGNYYSNSLSISFKLFFVDQSGVSGFLNIFYIKEVLGDNYYYSAAKLFKMNYNWSSETSQDIDIYDDYLFVAFSGEEKIRVYSISSKKLLAVLEAETSHGSSIQFSGERYVDDDFFPLLYVGGCISNTINVIRIVFDNECWSAHCVRTIFIPFDYGFFASPSIDVSNSILYIYSNKANTIQNNKYAIVSKWNLKDLKISENGRYLPSFVDKFEIPIEDIYQGHKYLNGCIFLTVSSAKSPYNPKIICIDIESKAITRSIDLSLFFDSETEGICYKKEGEMIRWFVTDYYCIYELFFRSL